MQPVIFGGIHAHRGVGGAEFLPRVCGGLDAVAAVHVALIHGDAVGVAGEEDHGVRAAVAAPHLDKVTGSGLGEKAAHLAGAPRRKPREAAHQGGITGGNADLIIVGFTFGGPDVIPEQDHMHLFCKALALFIGEGAGIPGAGLVDPIPVAAVCHGLEPVVDLLLSAGRGGLGSRAGFQIFRGDIAHTAVVHHLCPPVLVHGDNLHRRALRELGQDRSAGRGGAAQIQVGGRGVDIGGGAAVHRHQMEGLGGRAVAVINPDVGAAAGSPAADVQHLPALGLEGDIHLGAACQQGFPQLRVGAVFGVQLDVGARGGAASLYVQHFSTVGVDNVVIPAHATGLQVEDLGGSAVLFPQLDIGLVRMAVVIHIQYHALVQHRVDHIVFPYVHTEGLGFNRPQGKEGYQNGKGQRERQELSCRDSDLFAVHNDSSFIFPWVMLEAALLLLF